MNEVTDDNNSSNQTSQKPKNQRFSNRVKRLIGNLKRVVLSSRCELSGNTMDYTVQVGNFCVAHASCYYKQEMNIVTISSLYVVRQFRNIGLEDRLFEEIEQFAVTRSAKRIDGILGPEHNCFGGWIGLDKQKELYQGHGYRYGGELCGCFSFMEHWL